MDWVSIRDNLLQSIKKYKYVILVLGIGIFLMTLPEGEKITEEPSVPETTVQEPSISDSLEEILSQIDGVGKVSVLLTEESGSEIFYQTDEDSSTSDTGGSLRLETVIISDANRGETGLIRQTNPPSYRGAIVVCQGAERPSVKLAVVEAVANVTGISADRITVLKMK